MAQSYSANGKTHAVSQIRQPLPRFFVDWDRSGSIAVPGDAETTYVEGMSGTIEATSLDAGPSAIGPGIADTLRVSLDNTSARFSPSYGAGALYANINGNGGYGCLCRADMGFNVNGTPEYLTLFTGYLKEPAEAVRPQSTQLQALGVLGHVGNQRASTTLYKNIRTDTLLGNLRALLSPAPSWSGGAAATGIEYIPFAWLDDEPIVGEMLKVAEAEGGQLFAKYDATLVFRPATWLLSQTTSQFTFDATRIGDLRPRFDFQNLFNHIVVKYRPRYRSPGLQVVWSSSEVVAVPPSGTVTLWAQFQDPIDGSAVTPVASTDYTARSAGYADKTASVTITITESYAQRAKLSIVSGDSAQYLYVESLQLRGYPVYATEERVAEAEDSTSISSYGERVKEYSNPYVQTESLAQAIADSWLYRFKNPRTIVDLVDVPGLPWLELYDRVTVSQTSTGISRDFYIVRAEWSFGKRFTQNFTLIDAASLFANSDYFVIGTTALGNNGRAWY